MRTLKTYLRCGAPLPSLVSLSRHSRWRAGGWAGGYLVPGAAAGFSRLGCSLFCHGAHRRHENGHITIPPPWRETEGEWITSYNVWRPGLGWTLLASAITHIHTFYM